MTTEPSKDPGWLTPGSREKESFFGANWRAPQRLRKHHKQAFKMHMSKEQGYNGDTARCTFCNRLFRTEEIEVHHKNHNVNNNQLSNLAPACRACNMDDRAKWLAST